MGADSAPIPTEIRHWAKMFTKGPLICELHGCKKRKSNNFQGALQQLAHKSSISLNLALQRFSLLYLYYVPTFRVQSSGLKHGMNINEVTEWLWHINLKTRTVKT